MNQRRRLGRFKRAVDRIKRDRLTYFAAKQLGKTVTVDAIVPAEKPLTGKTTARPVRPGSVGPRRQSSRFSTVVSKAT